MVKAVLFDFDGTLADSLGIYLKAYRITLQHFGSNFADAQVIKTCFGKTEETITASLGMSEKAEKFRKFYFDQLHKHYDELRLFPDTLQTLDTLKNKQIKLSLVTFLHRELIDQAVDQLQIRNYFEIIISFNDVEQAKPAPQAVFKACDMLRVKPEEVLVIGDSKNDILIGKNAGSKTALYTPSENSKFYNFEELINLTHPDFVIKKLHKVVRLVQNV